MVLDLETMNLHSRTKSRELGRMEELVQALVLAVSEVLEELVWALARLDNGWRKCKIC